MPAVAEWGGAGSLRLVQSGTSSGQQTAACHRSLASQRCPLGEGRAAPTQVLSLGSGTSLSSPAGDWKNVFQ